MITLKKALKKNWANNMVVMIMKWVSRNILNSLSEECQNDVLLKNLKLVRLETFKKLEVL